MDRLARYLTIVGVASVLASAGGAATAAARPSLGVVSQSYLAERDFERMEDGGVETLRILVRRAIVEPARGEYDWSSVDPAVAGAAARGIEPLPFVYGSPAWVSDVEAHPPLDDRAERQDWRRFMTALVERYGPGGEFWSDRDEARPIRRWQLWNEPNFKLYWHPAPNPRDYARLVTMSADAIRDVDPEAEVMLAGVARVRLGTPWWTFLRDLYEVRGIERKFEYVALHPYSHGVRVLEQYVRLARRVMAAAGDRKTPLAITEVGWASDGDPGAQLVVGRRRQARLLRRSFELLSQPHPGWRISDVQWYAWQDTLAIEAGCSFCTHAGLFDVHGAAKPAWWAFQRVAAG